MRAHSCEWAFLRGLLNGVRVRIVSKSDLDPGKVSGLVRECDSRWRSAESLNVYINSVVVCHRLRGGVKDRGEGEGWGERMGRTRGREGCGKKEKRMQEVVKQGGSEGDEKGRVLTHVMDGSRCVCVCARVRD